MKGGDISNEVPRRLLVTVDAVTSQTVSIKKVLRFIPQPVTEYHWDRLALNRLWNYAMRTGVNVELVCFGMTEADAERLMSDLDAKVGTNPCNWVQVYADRATLVGDLAYRPEVLGVIDTPEYQAMYGLRGIGREHL